MSLTGVSGTPISKKKGGGNFFERGACIGKKERIKKDPFRKLKMEKTAKNVV